MAAAKTPATKIPRIPTGRYCPTTAKRASLASTWGIMFSPMAAAPRIPRKVTAQSKESHMGIPTLKAFWISRGPAEAKMR